MRTMLVFGTEQQSLRLLWLGYIIQERAYQNRAASTDFKVVTTLFQTLCLESLNEAPVLGGYCSVPGTHLLKMVAKWLVNASGMFCWLSLKPDTLFQWLLLCSRIPILKSGGQLAGREAGDFVLAVTETRETCFQWLLLCSRIPILKKAASWLVENPGILCQL